MSRLPPLAALCLCLAAPAEAAPEKSSKIAFVLLSRAQLPAAAEVARAFATFAPKGERLRPAGAPVGKPQRAVQQFELGTGGTTFVALMPVPVPKGEADEAARYSVSALGTGWKLPAHKAHLLVTLTQTGDVRKVDVLSRFTSLLAAVAQSSPAVGIYWGDAGATHDPKFFLKVAREPEVVSRLFLWTGMSMAREKDGRLSLLSLGMEQLGLPDLLLVAPKSAADEAMSAFFEFLEVITNEGKPIPENDTVGRSAEERLPVHYVPSPADPSRKVWRVELPR
jgi:hypothetical protein